jgi:hypothetical protein
MAMLNNQMVILVEDCGKMAYCHRSAGSSTRPLFQVCLPSGSFLSKNETRRVLIQQVQTFKTAFNAFEIILET